MLQNWFILLPEICMLSFFFVAWPINLLRREKTSKTFFSLAQIFLIGSLLLSVLFYNKSVFPHLWQNTAFSTLFKSFVYLLAWAWFYLSSKWFLNKNRQSFKFYAICFALLFCFGIIASATSLLTIAVMYPLISLFCYMLVFQHWDTTRVEKIGLLYAVCAIFFTLFLWGGIYLVYTQVGSFEYAMIQKFYETQTVITPKTQIAALMIVAAFMFMLALAPFHNWFIGFISTAVLPVCGFLTLVPPLINLCALINLMTNCFRPLIPFIMPVISGFAVFSIIIGALSANGEKDIRRLFAFLTVYCLGVSLIGLSEFSAAGQIASFAYLIVAILSFAGIYTVFLGMKLRGEYVSGLADLSGLYQNRPYMSAALLIFMFSLIGLAPTLGFFGCLSILNNLVAHNYWGWTAFLFLSLLLVTGACLRVVRTIYFAVPENKFDRTDKAIYICLFINMILVLISLLNPSWLINDAFVILGGVA